MFFFSIINLSSMIVLLLLTLFHLSRTFLSREKVYVFYDKSVQRFCFYYLGFVVFTRPMCLASSQQLQTLTKFVPLFSLSPSFSTTTLTLQDYL